MTEEWAEELKDLPFTSQQKGRFAALLKSKAKIGVTRAPRKTYEPCDVFKKKKLEDDQVIAVPPKLDPGKSVLVDKFGNIKIGEKRQRQASIDKKD